MSILKKEGIADHPKEKTPRASYLALPQEEPFSGP